MSSSLSDRFESLALPHLENVFRMARRLARDEAEADDLVQETYIRAFRGFSRFELRDHGIRPWLFRILHNAFYTSRVRSRKQPATLDDVNFDHFEADVDRTPTESGIENIDWESVDEDLKRAVEALQPEFREVLLLWAFEDLSYMEIAAICECPVGTVMSRLYRARQSLGDSLAGWKSNRDNEPNRA